MGLFLFGVAVGIVGAVAFAVGFVYSAWRHLFDD